MSIPTVIYWPPCTGNTDAIAIVQNVDVGDNFIIRSNVPDLPGVYQYNGIARKISFTSNDDNHLSQYLIKGIGSPVDSDGNPTQVFGEVEETILIGPNDNTVESDNIYTRINSITVLEDDSSNVSIGFGTSGIMGYVFLDYNRTIFQAAIQLNFVNRATMTASVFESLSKPETPNIQFGTFDKFAPLPAFYVSDDFKDETEDRLGNLLSPVALTWANVKLTTSDSLYFTVLQQGMRS